MSVKQKGAECRYYYVAVECVRARGGLAFERLLPARRLPLLATRGAPAPVARSAPNDAHDGSAYARACRRAFVCAGWPTRYWCKSPLCHEKRDLTLYLPPRRNKHRKYLSRLPESQHLRGYCSSPHQQVQSRDQDRTRDILLANAGFYWS